MKDSKIKNVQPLRTRDQIARFRDMINLLGRFYEEEPKKTGRNQKKSTKPKIADPEKVRLLFDLGINWGLRVSDLVSLTVDDVTLTSATDNHIRVREQKTGKIRTITVTPKIKKEIEHYIESHKLENSHWLFPSRQRNKQGEIDHINTKTLYLQLEKVADYLGWDYVGTHTLRKTYGYWLYKASDHNIALVQRELNHSSQAVTLRYIGITQEESDKVLNKFNL